MDKVYTIIVNYKTEDLTKRAVASIHEEFIDSHILIVDNESTVDSITSLNNLISEQIEVIESKENLGFAGGVNYGVNYLKKKHKDVKYIFLLNPDALTTHNVISKLLDVLKSNAMYSAVSPHIYDNKTSQDWFAGTMIDFQNCKIDNNPTLPKDTNSLVDVFNGCAVIFDIKKFNDAGQFDEDTFLYYDEANLAMNFIKLGYQCVYVPSLEVYHDVSSSTGNYSFLKSYYMTRNHLSFFKKYKKNCGLCAYFVPLRNLLSSLKHLRIDNVKGIIKGISDFHQGKKGK